MSLVSSIHGLAIHILPAKYSPRTDFVYVTAGDALEIGFSFPCSRSRVGQLLRVSIVYDNRI